MPALKCSVGIQQKSGSGFQPLRRGKMPRPLFEAEPRNLADTVSRAANSSVNLLQPLFSTESQVLHPWQKRVRNDKLTKVTSQKRGARANGA